METYARQFSLRNLLMLTAALGTLLALYKTGLLLYARGGTPALILILSVMLISFLLMFGVFFIHRPRF